MVTSSTTISSSSIIISSVTSWKLGIGIGNNNSTEFLSTSSITITDFRITTLLPGITSLPVNRPFNLWQEILIWILVGIVSFITVIGNIMVILAFLKDASIRQPNNYCIVSLAASDLLIGLFSMPFYTLYLLLDYWPLGPLLCDLWLTTDYTACLVSQYTVLLITIDRYCSVRIPARYRVWRTNYKLKVLIVFVWILSFGIFFTSIVGWPLITKRRLRKPHECFVPFRSNKVFNTSLIFAYFWVSLVILLWLYHGIYRIAYKIAKKSDNRKLKTTLLKGNEIIFTTAKAPFGTIRSSSTKLTSHGSKYQSDEDRKAKQNDKLKRILGPEQTKLIIEDYPDDEDTDNIIPYESIKNKSLSCENSLSVATASGGALPHKETTTTSSMFEKLNVPGLRKKILGSSSPTVKHIQFVDNNENDHSRSLTDSHNTLGGTLTKGNSGSGNDSGSTINNSQSANTTKSTSLLLQTPSSSHSDRKLGGSSDLSTNNYQPEEELVIKNQYYIEKKGVTNDNDKKSKTSQHDDDNYFQGKGNRTEANTNQHKRILPNITVNVLNSIHPDKKYEGVRGRCSPLDTASDTKVYFAERLAKCVKQSPRNKAKVKIVNLPTTATTATIILANQNTSFGSESDDEYSQGGFNSEVSDSLYHHPTLVSRHLSLKLGGDNQTPYYAANYLPDKLKGLTKRCFTKNDSASQIQKALEKMEDTKKDEPSDELIDIRKEGDMLSSSQQISPHVQYINHEQQRVEAYPKYTTITTSETSDSHVISFPAKKLITTPIQSDKSANLGTDNHQHLPNTNNTNNRKKRKLPNIPSSLTSNICNSLNTYKNNCKNVVKKKKPKLLNNDINSIENIYHYDDNVIPNALNLAAGPKKKTIIHVPGVETIPEDSNSSPNRKQSTDSSNNNQDHIKDCHSSIIIEEDSKIIHKKPSATAADRLKLITTKNNGVNKLKLIAITPFRKISTGTNKKEITSVVKEEPPATTCKSTDTTTSLCPIKDFEMALSKSQSAHKKLAEHEKDDDISSFDARASNFASYLSSIIKSNSTNSQGGTTAAAGAETLPKTIRFNFTGEKEALLGKYGSLGNNELDEETEVGDKDDGELNEADKTERDLEKKTMGIGAFSRLAFPIGSGGGGGGTPPRLKNNSTDSKTKKTNTTTTHKKRQKKNSRARKALKTITCIMGAFVLCWTPFHIIETIWGFCNTCYINPHFYAFTYWLCYLNSPINPFMYALANVHFKQAFIKLLNCRKMD